MSIQVCKQDLCSRFSCYLLCNELDNRLRNRRPVITVVGLGQAFVCNRAWNNALLLPCAYQHLLDITSKFRMALHGEYALGPVEALDEGVFIRQQQLCVRRQVEDNVTVHLHDVERVVVGLGEIREHLGALGGELEGCR